MSERRFTAGPWIARHNPGKGHNAGWFIGQPVVGDTRATLARVYSLQTAKAEVEANARLIAASPDFADAAECYVRWADGFKETSPDNFRRWEDAFGSKLRAALAKAAPNLTLPVSDA